LNMRTRLKIRARGFEPHGEDEKATVGGMTDCKKKPRRN
jgi:hypothetical protein